VLVKNPGWRADRARRSPRAPSTTQACTPWPCCSSRWQAWPSSGC